MRKRIIRRTALALALMSALPAAAAKKSPEDVCLNGGYAIVMEKCTGKAQKLSDYSHKSNVRIVPGSRIRFLPQTGPRANAFYLYFVRVPEFFTLTWLDEAGNALRTDEYGTENDPVYFNSLYIKEYGILIPEDAAGFEFVSGSDGFIAELRLYATAEELPATAERWQPSHEKADLLFLIAHPDDEHLMMGGIVPIYAGERGMKVQPVYLTADLTRRKAEALDGLWSNGQRNMPVFLDLIDKKSDNLKKALEIWERAGVDPLGMIVEQIRRFRPEVVVTHDAEGEYGHGAHRAAAYFLQLAAEQAADPAYYPESAEKYGAWQVKKVYLHLYGDAETQTVLPVDEPLAAFGGKTAFEMAQIGYEPHSGSQGEQWLKLLRSREYDCSRYGLVTSAVGPDEAKNDFFEHLGGTDQ
ncbi:MAG: PIG-L family deacetylase [Clostridia bacterium]|nr:PIG-L family deacetylase [Clostridia bacterium]